VALVLFSLDGDSKGNVREQPVREQQRDEYVERLAAEV
jgi:hypothetical protein